MKRRNRNIMLSLFLISLFAVAQKNLVPNFSFENFKNKKVTSISNAPPWRGIATVDYFTKPFANDTSRFKGARTGIGYAGLRFQKDYKEFIYVKLVKPLRKGVKYNFEMHIRLAFWSNAALKSFTAFFSKNPYRKIDVADSTNCIRLVEKKGIRNNYEWVKISGEYTASGIERILTIGNFSENVKKDMIKLNIFKLGFKEAYYFVDDISLYDPRDTVKATILTPVVVKDTVKQDTAKFTKQDLKVGDIVKLNNILFEVAKAELLPESFTELDKLALHLIEHPTMEIQINGHTDNTGSKRKNQTLSENRAKTVFEYLLQKGAQNKMYFKGFGSTMPIATNDTEEGKSQNRRVEIQVLKQ